MAGKVIKSSFIKTFNAYKNQGMRWVLVGQKFMEKPLPGQEKDLRSEDVALGLHLIGVLGTSLPRT